MVILGHNSSFRGTMVHLGAQWFIEGDNGSFRGTIVHLGA